MNDPGNAPSSKRWRKFLIVAAIGFALLWFAVPPRVITKPLHLLREPNGLLSPIEPPHYSGLLSFEAWLGSSAIKWSELKAGGESAEEHCRFAAKRIVIVNRSPHLLMQRIGQCLVNELSQFADLEQLDYYPFNSDPDHTSRAPDLSLILYLESITEEGWLWQRTVATKIHCSVTNLPPTAGFWSGSYRRPPIPMIAEDLSEEFVIQQNGVRSSSAQYREEAAEIAKTLSQSVKRGIEEKLKEHGPLSDLPAAFYPPHQEPTKLPLEGNLFRQRLVSSCSRLMIPEHSVWCLGGTMVPEKMLAEVEKRLLADGWQVTHQGNDPGRSWRHFSRGREGMTCGEVSKEECVFGWPSSPPSLRLEYVVTMPEADISLAIDEAIATCPHPDQFDCLLPWMSKEQSELLLKKLEATGRRTWTSAILSARLNHEAGNDEAARSDLLQAYLLRVSLPDARQIGEGELNELAKQLGNEKLPENLWAQLWDSLDRDQTLEKLGFRYFAPDKPIPPSTIESDVPVYFCTADEEGKLVSIELMVQPSPNGAGGPNISSLRKWTPEERPKRTVRTTQTSRFAKG